MDTSRPLLLLKLCYSLVAVTLVTTSILAAETVVLDLATHVWMDAIAQPRARRRIAVLNFDFSNVSSPGFYNSIPGVSRGVSDILVDRLVKDGTYALIERSRIDAVLREQNLGTTGRLDPSTAAEVGKILGVDAVIIGAVTRMDAQSRNSGGSFGIRLPFGLAIESTDIDAYVQLNARLVDTSSGEILAVAQGTGNVSQSDTNLSGYGFGGRVGGGSSTSNEEKLVFLATEKAIEQVATELVGAASKLGGQSAVAASIVVADVSGNQIVLNQGDRAGLRVGMRLVIERVGKEIKDPVSGQVLRRSTQPVAQVQIVEVDARSSVARMISGGQIRVGDLAKALSK
ncbi:MAG: CsgG/HfaB family protein [Pseudanabaenaceae cyanobacterium bins.68]|nr:CsgG/HfaB family protein [Pseudanabaenaceae cyanobacterium bins.68]